MIFKREFASEYWEGFDLRTLPIPEAPLDIQMKMEQNEWKSVPIIELVTNSPKILDVIPNQFQTDGIMAWPAYYKTVRAGSEHDGRQRGLGELAQTIEGTIQTSPCVKVRPEVKSRLDMAQHKLNLKPETSHLQLVVVDGYRSVDVQKKLFDAYLAFVRDSNPDLSEEDIFMMARKMVSEAPKDSEMLRISPPPHSTGGAIDIVMVQKDRIDTDSDYWLQDAMVPFGAKFDEMMNPVYHNQRSETVFYERKLAKSGQLDGEDLKALENRRILFYAMIKSGFSNYFTEFWHYDFGNQFNAVIAGGTSAQFGYAGGISEAGVVEDFTAETAAYQAYVAKYGPDNGEKVKHHFGI